MVQWSVWFPLPLASSKSCLVASPTTPLGRCSGRCRRIVAMFERFPQLKRLERLLSRAQAFSPKKTKQSKHRRDLADSPIQAHSRKSKKPSKKTAHVKTVHSPLDVRHGPPPGKRVPISQVKDLFDSDIVLDRKKCTPKPIHQIEEKRDSIERKRTWTSSVRSPREVLRSRGKLHMEKLDPSPLNQRGNIRHVPVLKTPGKRAFYRMMQDAPPSDALCVLSEEESDEQEDIDRQKTVRYPLPTMPLSIMVPVKDIPDCVIPMDFHTVLKKISRFDGSIAQLMENRKRLETSYGLFDDLCTSFRGPENLDRFLRSLMTNKPMSSLYASDPPAESKQGAPSPSTPKQIGNQKKTSLPSDASKLTGESSSTPGSNVSRLFRPTVSTTMKQVEAVNHRPKRILANDHSTDTSIKSRYRPSGANRRSSINRARKTKQKAPNPVSEEDARADMLLRVRRNIMHLPWLSRPRRSSGSRSRRPSHESQ